MNFFFERFSLYFFIVHFDSFSIKLFILINFFVVIFDHLLISFLINRWFPQGLLSSSFLCFDNQSGFRIRTCIFTDLLRVLQLFSCPPENRSIIIQLEILRFQYFQRKFLFQQQVSWFPFR